MQNIKSLLIVSILFLLVSAKNLLAQTSYVDQIDSLLAKTFNQGNFNGNALVLKNNEIIYVESFGYTNASKDKKLTQATRFNIGSIYKEFSAMALMMLVVEGKLNLENSISKFIPSLPSWEKKSK